MPTGSLLSAEIIVQGCVHGARDVFAVVLGCSEVRLVQIPPAIDHPNIIVPKDLREFVNSGEVACHGMKISVGLDDEPAPRQTASVVIVV
jgi:hypothetical protein